MKDDIGPSIYMIPVADVDIINIVNKFKNKTSKDFTNMSMINLKKIIHMLPFFIKGCFS